MSDLPPEITQSHLWQSTLAPRASDEASDARDRLRSAFVTLRDRAALLAAEIRRDLPQLTLHEQKHMDALWETASTIVGTSFMLTPTEGFVLGGSFLLHDLGMALPSVDGGIQALRTDPRWADLVTYEYQTTLDRDPSATELTCPSEDIYNRVLLTLLQQVHAANAERLVFSSFATGNNTERIHLIDDAELRQTFGRLIGRVAHSHWWTVAEVERQFQRTIGAAHWCPKDWTIDPLKVACVLRCADAAQIDARRAPLFLKATSDLPTLSADHWTFQSKLNKPYLEEDALVFTTGHAFNITDAPAWWLCLETLRAVDKELGTVDALFADKGSDRFAAKRVAGIEEPERLVSYIQTDGWLPINATIHVTDLPRVIKSVGGDELYGKHPEVTLRELIQNASDAVRARRVYERRETGYGSIRVSLSKGADNSFWLEVQDDGLGMSRFVLTNFLLDFGHPFWGSPEMQREFPGLLSSGLKQIGKYGIGFFSVFMLAEQVQVITRRSDSGIKNTLVLEFSRGLKGRPLLREANANEQLVDGGTRIRLRLLVDPKEQGGLLRSARGDKAQSLADICTSLCPALEVDLFVTEDTTTRKLLAGGDWQTIGSEEFLKRIPAFDWQESLSEEEISQLRVRAAENLRFLRNRDGEVVGRALVTVGYAGLPAQRADLAGVVTVGGLRSCGLSGIAGVLCGMPMRASRDAAKPLVEDSELKRWAEEQALLVPRLWPDSESQAACAQYIRLCGGDTGALPIAKNRDAWVSVTQIKLRTDIPDELLLIDHFAVAYSLKHVHEFKLNDNVFVVKMNGIPGLLQCRVKWPRNVYTDFAGGGGHTELTLAGAFIEAIAHAWGVDVKVLTQHNDLKREAEVVIGHSQAGTLKEHAIVLKRPIE